VSWSFDSVLFAGVIFLLSNWTVFGQNVHEPYGTTAEMRVRTPSMAVETCLAFNQVRSSPRLWRRTRRVCLACHRCWKRQ